MSAREMIGCRIPVEWKNRLETIALEEGKHLAQVVYAAIEQYLQVEEQLSVDTKIRAVLQLPETLETNPAFSSLSQQVQTFEAKLDSIQKLLATLSPSIGETEQERVLLTSEQLALILGVTPRAVNDAAAKGHTHFTQWTQKFNKGGQWTFEVINPGMKKCDRRFFQAL
jgi:predicted DNA-binding protein